MPVESVLIDLITIAVLVYGLMILPKGAIRWLFVVAVLLMAVYKIYDPASDMRSLLWARHVPVYLGEAFFYYFIVSFSKRYIEVESEAKPQQTVLRQNLLVLAPLIMLATSVSWYQIVTDEGLPHIFTLPLFVLVISLVRLRLTVYESKYIAVVSLFTLAVSSWIMIHVSEFLVESQNLVTGLDRYMAHIEFFWFCAGAALFVAALVKFKDIPHGPTAKAVK